MDKGNPCDDNGIHWGKVPGTKKSCHLVIEETVSIRSIGDRIDKLAYHGVAA
jgi:hypothetical protein